MPRHLLAVVLLLAAGAVTAQVRPNQPRDPAQFASPTVTGSANLIALPYETDTANEVDVYVGSRVTLQIPNPKKFMTVLPFQCAVGKQINFNVVSGNVQFTMVKPGACQILIQTGKRNYDVRVTAVAPPQSNMVSQNTGPTYYWNIPK